MADKKATLKVDGVEETLELPVYEGTVGPDVVDVRSLTGKGLFYIRPWLCINRSNRICDYIHRRRSWRTASPRLPN